MTSTTSGELDMPMFGRWIASVLAVAIVSGSALAASRGDPVKKFDTDNDGTLDHIEIRKAAMALFARLDPDHDGTLDVRELRGRLTANEIAAADPDQDGTLSVNEYLAVVSQRSDAADPDHDGTLDTSELKTPAGRALLQLLQ